MAHKGSNDGGGTDFSGMIKNAGLENLKEGIHIIDKNGGSLFMGEISPHDALQKFSEMMQKMVEENPPKPIRSAVSLTLVQPSGKNSETPQR